MKRLFLCVLVSAAVMSPAPLSAAAQPTGRYLVGTRRAARFLRVPLIQDSELSQARDLITFEQVNGFAAELTEEEAAELRASSEVRFVEHDPERHISARMASPSLRSTGIVSTQVRDRNAQTTPYGIAMVQASLVWPAGTGSKIRIGIIDTGIDRFHVDLQDRYRGGKNFISGGNDPQDDNGHGTHVAGTIGATDNGVGVVGVAPTVEIYALKVLNASGEGTSSRVIEAVEWAIANHMNIISLSLGSKESSQLEEEAFKRAADAGILAIAASGNDGQENLIGFPAAYPTVLAVGAVDELANIASFSNQGPELRVVAPGVRVLSSVPTGSAQIAEVAAGSSSYAARTIIGSPKLGEVKGSFVFCGYGGAGEFPSSVKGNIALIRRGGVPTRLTFNEKTKNAKAAGASAVVVFDDGPPTPFNPTLIGSVTTPAGCKTNCTTKDDPADLAFPWPLTLFISNVDGEKLITDAPATIAASARVDDYKELNGTSMATPHVSGVAALIWSLAPNASAELVRNAILTSAKDLGAAGLDTKFGYGLVDARAAALVLAPEKFVTGGSPLPTGPIPSGTKRRSTRH